jgi:glycosyltransferase involved in cell wall biosynthesis
LIKGKSIICFGGEDWWYHHPHSKNHLMRRFARAGNRVMFVNSISMGLPSLGSSALLTKIRRKLPSYARMVRRAEDGLIVVTPLALPFYSNSICRILNRLLLTWQMRLLMVAFDLRDPILWIAIPTAGEVAGRLGEQLLVYQVSDKYEANRMDHATSSDTIATMHHKMLDKADIIYFSGRKLYEEETRAFPQIAARSKLLQQAVDFDHFAAATLDNPDVEFPNGPRAEPGATNPPADILGIPKPRLGYFGAIETWLLDQDLIRYVSSQRPEWHWIFIGLKTGPLDIEALPNVHYLGSKPYSELPGYAREFQVCVLPWTTRNEFVSYGSPIKVREYLATGKPVVITPLYEYESMDGILRIARDYGDFVRKVEDALTKDTEAQRCARQQAIESSTWNVRAEEVSDDLATLIEHPNQLHRSRV